MVFCNCDDAFNKEEDLRTSAFALFFYKNFKKLGLKKLISFSALPRIQQKILSLSNFLR
ncbi:MAG: adenine-specific methyltransferase EcoRI family protein [Bacteroidales bacterium]|nr:adenine-specific methyltransferase EcoRI family protein [Bacteroidales bacterium]